MGNILFSKFPKITTKIDQFLQSDIKISEILLLGNYINFWYILLKICGSGMIMGRIFWQNLV